jgi:predicted dehydrogenase
MAVRVGLVGCGHMGGYHASKLSESSSADFVGCFDIVGEKAENIASKYGVESFESLDSMPGRVDAVSIAVPTIEHPEVASVFLERGIPVLLEKPISFDLESAEKLVKLAEAKHTILQIGHSERFNPAFMAVEQGISEPKFIETHRLAPFKGRGDDVAVILDLMIHDLDLILALTNSFPEKIEAAGVAVITDSVDIVNARLTFPTGCVANITASRISIKEMRKLRIFQKSGYTSIDMASKEAEQYVVVPTDDKDYKEAPIFGRYHLPDGRAVVRRTVEIPSGDNLSFEIDSFIESVKGEHPPAVSGRDGLNVLKVAGEIEELCREYREKI